MLIALSEFASVLCVDLSVFKRVYGVKNEVRFFSPVRESIRVVFTLFHGSRSNRS